MPVEHVALTLMNSYPHMGLPLSKDFQAALDLMEAINNSSRQAYYPAISSLTPKNVEQEMEKICIDRAADLNYTEVRTRLAYQAGAQVVSLGFAEGPKLLTKMLDTWSAAVKQLHAAYAKLPNPRGYGMPGEPVQTVQAIDMLADPEVSSAWASAVDAERVLNGIVEFLRNDSHIPHPDQGEFDSVISVMNVLDQNEVFTCQRAEGTVLWEGLSPLYSGGYIRVRQQRRIISPRPLLARDTLPLKQKLEAAWRAEAEREREGMNAR